ncbi:MAG: type II toxin-antitoxin system Phd/YefM family antitoxin [Gemmatimonadetes bacterium]|nr:type II toxin-antitoxin system Phd/YefM family antitoxin [Gemmatimonadota bacterium]
MKTLPALVFRRQFGQVLDDVARKREPVTITRGNRPLVVLVPAQDYESAAARPAVREGRLRLAATRVAEWKARHAARLRDLDPVALVRASRAAR